MPLIEKVISFISYQIVIPIIVSVITTIITGKIKDKRKRRQEAKDKFREALSKIKDKEEITNSPVTNNKFEDWRDMYNLYLDDLENLKKLINVYETDIPKEDIELLKKLCREIKQKLIIYKQAFVVNDDISSLEKGKYFHCYIEPDKTVIQQIVEELLK